MSASRGRCMLACATLTLRRAGVQGTRPGQESTEGPQGRRGSEAAAHQWYLPRARTQKNVQLGAPDRERAPFAAKAAEYVPKLAPGIIEAMKNEEKARVRLLPRAR